MMERREDTQANEGETIPISCPEGFEPLTRVEVTFWRDGTVSLDCFTAPEHETVVAELTQSRHKFAVTLEGRFT